MCLNKNSFDLLLLSFVFIYAILYLYLVLNRFAVAISRYLEDSYLFLDYNKKNFNVVGERLETKTPAFNNCPMNLFWHISYFSPGFLQEIWNI